MNCPHCNKLINAVTGFQEAEKFQKHLNNCKKNPKRRIISEGFQMGDSNVKWIESVNATRTSLKEALEIRSKSGQ